MKKFLAMLLACVMLVLAMSSLAGCGSAGSGEEEDLGAEIRAHFVGEIYDFDPAKAYTNDEAMQIMSLIYEPLFTLDSNGNLQNALAQSYRFYEFRGKHLLDIELRDTAWSNGNPIKAEEVVWSWQRILDSDFPCQAATLLYEIKNARAAKIGEIIEETKKPATIYDVGITAPEDRTITIEFAYEMDGEAQQNFLRNLTSVALSPVNESSVTFDGRDDYWSKRVATLVTNGPFSVRALTYAATRPDAEGNLPEGKEFRLERNNYYRRGAEGNGSKELYVSPAKFMEYWDRDLDEVFTQYIEGTIFYVGDIPLDKRAEYLSSARITNLLSTYTYVMDVTDPLLSSVKVRRALSLAIDRETLVSEATQGLGVPATGFVSHGVYDGSRRGAFSATTAGRESALATTANKEAAVALLREAKGEGYTSGDISILIRDNAEEEAIAKAVVAAWKEVFRSAGISVAINYTKQSKTTYRVPSTDSVAANATLYSDAVQDAYTIKKAKDENGTVTGVENGFAGCNVLGIDYQMLSTDAFGALASLAAGLSGNGILTGNSALGEDEILVKHISGFNNAAYNDTMERAFAEKNVTARAALLHEAEDILLSELPVIPLLFNQSASCQSGDLKRVYTSYYGFPVMTRAELRNYAGRKFTVAD